MWTLALLVALGWFWFLFYGVGPLTTATEIAVTILSLTFGCLVFAVWGAVAVIRRRAR